MVLHIESQVQPRTTFWVTKCHQTHVHWIIETGVSNYLQQFNSESRGWGWGALERSFDGCNFILFYLWAMCFGLVIQRNGHNNFTIHDKIETTPFSQAEPSDLWGHHQGGGGVTGRSAPCGAVITIFSTYFFFSNRMCRVGQSPEPEVRNAAL